MKKIALVMAFVAAFGVTVMAQGTVLSDRPKENCYYTSWAEGDTLASCGMRVGGMNFTDLATAYYSKDTLKIYGVAISAVARDKGPDNPYYHDTTLDSMYCQVRVYESLGDSLGVLRESRLHLRDSAVSYYLAADRWDFTNYRPDGSLGKFDPIPVYELFFEQPVSVCDSFYIGFFFDKDIMLYDSISRRQYYPYRYHMAALGFKSFKGRAEPIVYAQRFRPDNVNHPGDWLFIRNATEYLYMYAITEPGDGTSGGGSGSDTTLTITASDAAARYVSVQPNPAVDEARVLSSLGLRGIEAYNAGGQKVYEGKAEGLEATLDVKGWPRGTYLLRITTPMGTVTKKLLVE